MFITNKKQMNQIDALAIQKGIPSIVLMEHAAIGIADIIRKQYDLSTRFHVFCGTGNNGGDGLAAARLLSVYGYDVCITLAEGEMSIDCQINASLCKNMHLPFVQEISDADVLIDALFGTGLSRNIEGAAAALIEKMNASGKPIIAIDMPSGIRADDGCVMNTAVKASQTITIQYGKIGLYVYPGREYAGKIEVVSLHLPQMWLNETEFKVSLIDEKMLSELLPKRNRHSHKGSYGKVLCIGGSEQTPGAILMASKSALKCGAGMMSIALPKQLCEMSLNCLAEAMLLPCSSAQGQISDISLIEEKKNQFDCILVGCGLGREERHEKLLKMLLCSDQMLVIDADGLFALKKYLSLLEKRHNVILTPHMAEFARLIDADINDVLAHSVDYVRQFCEKYPSVTLVLKSETTLIGYQDKLIINTFGNNGLATGGSGDALAGMIIGFLAQNKDPLTAAVLGVGIHALCADALKEEISEYCLLPSDVIEKIPMIIKRLLDNQQIYVK